jgi:MOSC domain-containing protein YiiM
MAHVFQISLSKGGVPKTGLAEARVGEAGLEGDIHRSSTHGGPLRALCLYSVERIVALQLEGHPVFPGSAGENLTLSGIDWDEVAPGVRLRVGAEVEIEVTTYTTPCSKIASSFRDGVIERMSQDKHPGWARVYARVLRGGGIRTGDKVTLTAASPAS